MKVVEAYQCEICESVYNSIEECKKCENDCSDRCNYENGLVLSDDGNDSIISMEDISKISKMLLDAKQRYTTDLLLRKF